MEQAKSSPELSGNHRRGVATTLGLLDELLCRVEECAEARERHGALYHERNNLNAAQRKELLKKAAHLRSSLQDAQRDVGLAGVTQDAASDVWSRCASFRENLMELAGAQLRPYGDLSPDAQAFMDRLSHGLPAGVDELLQSVKHDEGLS